ncbi:MAG: metallophosphoesterase, partial [Synergistaceae bacterium]|nr:metallophosphoesterase [Synergistaceae bacterium]
MTLCSAASAFTLDEKGVPEAGEERSVILVISDLHLGADDSYSENVTNRPRLVKFLGKVREAADVKELVIAGDMIDEWFIPAGKDTYEGKSQKEFVQRVADNNKEVFDAFSAIIGDGKIKVTYVPGNHDLLVSDESVEAVLPGIHQARDVRGLGTYTPEEHPEIAIEHGHRYNFFCAPDPISN